eukprot:scaffold24150_cov101-Isochrysis_galbana.AAC.2
MLTGGTAACGVYTLPRVSCFSALTDSATTKTEHTHEGHEQIVRTKTTDHLRVAKRKTAVGCRLYAYAVHYCIRTNTL